MKWSNPGNGVAPSTIPRCSSYRKGSLRVTLLSFMLHEWLLCNRMSSFCWKKNWFYRLCHKKVCGNWQNNLAKITSKFQHVIWTYSAQFILIVNFWCYTVNIGFPNTLASNASIPGFLGIIVPTTWFQVREASLLAIPIKYGWVHRLVPEAPQTWEIPTGSLIFWDGRTIDSCIDLHNKITLFQIWFDWRLDRYQTHFASFLLYICLMQVVYSWLIA